jgi:hypothetical protein
VEVGRQLTARQFGERGYRQGESVAYGAADLDHRIEGDSGRAAGHTEAWEPFDPTLSRWKHHATVGRA